MTFGQVITGLKAGKAFARAGWNGKGMWIVLVRRWTTFGVSLEESGVVALHPWIGMKAADGSFVPWLASQTDMLAEDWVEVSA
jgi:hypothetical protein